ncbi:ribonuclease HIII [Sporosarcina sp. P12(2017)]|uniref:ribonuclease HIII n=1 Tax=unclassified Sporosarcina TaxID=2647733 RepID=UPI000C16638A|nr:MULTISPECIES: ribonuclease HIII [unclassified Sporosarcina]PIC58529.1 ribonuclease HIII [Sporosarcina sp. P10]PIC61848.1 ribonuclease HIII [Sporosarcina sp. P12(2017)]
MSNQVIVLSEKEILEVVRFYETNKVIRNAPGVVFAAKIADTSITVYRSGKVLFQGAGADREAARWGTIGTVAKVTPSGAKGDTLPANFASSSVLGSDETGTGDFFGPITVAACFVSSDQIELVKELGVKDSKQLTDAYMQQIADDLKQVVTYSVLTLDNVKYNEIQSKGWSQGKIKALLHNQALQEVLDQMFPVLPEHILIDQFAERRVYYNYLKDESSIIQDKVLFSTKAENLHVSVATASILARVAFLEAMDQLSSQAGVTLPKGAGPKVDQIACQIIRKKGEPFLHTITKVHFANTQKALKLAYKK